MYRTVAVLAAIGVAVAGCGGNDGGSTTCSDFNGMTQDARGAAVARMLKERTGLNSSTSDVQGKVGSVSTFCQSKANADRTIGDAR